MPFHLFETTKKIKRDMQNVVQLSGAASAKFIVYMPSLLSNVQCHKTA